VRAVEVGEDRLLRVVELEAPAPGPAQVALEVSYCGICGSDLHFRDVPALFPGGTVPGHEFSGRITALGAGVEGWAIGDRVCVLPFAQCGECESCLRGEEQVCPKAIASGVGLGTGRPGAYAERVTVDARMLFALPDSVDDRAGALTEPLAVGVRAVASCETAPAEPVSVIGAGPIGLLTALVLRERGYERATLISRNAARGALAAEIGLRVVGLEEALTGEPPACVFECAGTPAAARLAVEIARPLARIMLVGMALEPLDLSAPPILSKELTLRGVLAYTRADFAGAIELLASGAIPSERLISAVLPLEDAEAAFQSLTARGNTALKVLLAP
jgi:(R,R)-butanediol dehydrogenase / meso-butanediol dehydrogenase / diacetyl reductase